MCEQMRNHLPEHREQYYCEVCGEWRRPYHKDGFEVLAFDYGLQPSMIKCTECGTIYRETPKCFGDYVSEENRNTCWGHKCELCAFEEECMVLYQRGAKPCP